MAKALLSANTALLVKCSVKATSDSTVIENKVYYKLDSTNSVYDIIERPTASDLASAYEVVADGTTGATADVFVKISCIKDVPDLGGDPETIEITDLCSKTQEYIEGLQANDTLSFTANYNMYVLGYINLLKGAERDFEILFGDLAGKDGKFEFSGSISARVNGFGVNEVREMTINIVPSTGVELA